MTESFKDDLNGALRMLVADLIADLPTALKTFEKWCLDHTADLQLRALNDYWDT